MSDVEAETLLSSAPSLPRALFIRLFWRLLPILWLGYVLNIVDRTNLAVAQLNRLNDPLAIAKRGKLMLPPPQARDVPPTLS